MRLRMLLIALLALAGAGHRAAQPAAAATCFPQSGKCIHALFEGYWSANGGLAQQGYPLTDAFVEVSAVDGKPYLVQYFERARFERHPENAGTAYEVLLGLLGREQYLAKYGQQPPVAPLDGEERALVELVNGYRARNSLAPLALSPTLSQAAEWLSTDMAQKNYFDHTDSLGRDPFARMCAFGYCYDTWKGETLAAGNGDAAATLRQWQESPAHNAILLDPGARAIGIGRAQGGGYGWYWTADFGGERD